MTTQHGEGRRNTPSTRCPGNQGDRERPGGVTREPSSAESLRTRKVAFSGHQRGCQGHGGPAGSGGKAVSAWRPLPRSGGEGQEREESQGGQNECVCEWTEDGGHGGVAEGVGENVTGRRVDSASAEMGGSGWKGRRGSRESENRPYFSLLRFFSAGGGGQWGSLWA